MKIERGSLHTELKLKYSTCRLFSSMADLNLRQVCVIDMRLKLRGVWLVWGGKLVVLGR